MLQLFWTIAAHLPAWRLPAGLVGAMLGLCSLLAALCATLMIRRVRAARRREACRAAELLALRELAACVLGPQPADPARLRAVLEDAPVAAVLHFLRLQRGATQALVIAEAERAGVFDPALATLGCGIASREIAALRQLHFARAPRFRSAILRQVIRGSTPLVRVEALYSLVAMGDAPATSALAAWIEGTGPGCTPRHAALLQLIAERLPEALPQLARLVSNPALRDRLAVLAAQAEAAHRQPQAIGRVAARLRAPIHPARRGA